MIFSSENSGRKLRVARLALAHLFLVALSIGFACEPGEYYFDIEEGPFVLLVGVRTNIGLIQKIIDENPFLARIGFRRRF